MSRSTWLQVALLVACGPLVVHAQGVVPSPPWGTASSSSDGGTFVLDGTVARADRPLFVNGLVVGATSADGGVSTYAVKSVQDAPWHLGPGTQMSLVPNGNDLTANVGAMHLPTTFITQPACNSGQTCRWFADTGSWFGIIPNADVSGCAAGTEGGLKANSADHTLRYCNGTAPLVVASVLSASAALDFGTILTGASGTATMPVTGAVSGDAVSCNPTVALSPGVSVAYSYVSSADTVTVTEDFIGAVSIDPASANFKCVIVR